MLVRSITFNFYVFYCCSFIFQKVLAQHTLDPEVDQKFILKFLKLIERLVSNFYER